MCLNPIFVRGKPVACRKCLECLINISNQWAFRISQEASHYDKNCFITLTYNEVNRPKDDHLSKRDLQLFIKRLRDKVGYKRIRYFACGEYGSKKGRPHNHIILFGYDFEDRYFFSYDNKKNALYRSPLLESLWTKGFSSVAEVTFDSAKYCAKYMQKVPQDGRPSPFTLMSRKPGIGFDSIKPEYLLSDKIYVNGRFTRLPDYYIKVLDRDFGFKDLVQELKKRRSLRTSDFTTSDGYTFDFDKYFDYLFSKRKKYKAIFNDIFLDNPKIKDNPFNSDEVFFERKRKKLKKLLTGSNFFDKIISVEDTMRKSTNFCESDNKT